jgi:membrane fusion protein, macrolide-specific efflux system
MKKLHIVIAALLLTLVAAVAAYLWSRPKTPPMENVKVEANNLRIMVQSSGTVGPENKISITTPIAGRIDQILAEEGSRVSKGQVLAWMSSTDRAALMDSARVSGGEELERWKDVYRPTPILAPASGTIIARKIVVGQTVNQQTELFIISDRLVIVADVDETDLGKVKVGQRADVVVDSFRDQPVIATVVRIAHQSVVKNQINTYEVLLRPDSIPEGFRSGLTASVQFVFLEKEGAITIPTWVVEGRENSSLKLTVLGTNGAKEEREVKVGLSNGQFIEVIDGLKVGDTLLVKKQAVLGEPPPSAFGIGPRRR